MPVDKDQQETQARPFTPVRQVPPVGPVTFTPAGRHRGEDPTDLDGGADENSAGDTVDDLTGDASSNVDDADDDTASDVAASGAVDRTSALPPQREDGKTDWQRIQASFVDDPRASVKAAATMVDDAIAAIQARERQLRSNWEDNGADTEQLRSAFRDYRTLHDQLTGR